MAHTDEQITQAITRHGLDGMNTRTLQSRYSDLYGKLIKSTNTVWLRKQVAKALLVKEDADAIAQAKRDEEDRAAADERARQERAEAEATKAKGPTGDLPAALRVVLNRIEATTTPALRPFVDALPVSELRPLLVHYGQPADGGRAELARRLLQYLTGQRGEAAAPKQAKVPRKAGAAPKPVPVPAKVDGRRLPPVGTVIEKRTRDGRVVSCTIRDGEQVEYGGKIHTSISAAGRAAAADLGQFSKAIDGYIWWGIEKRAKGGAARSRAAGAKLPAAITASLAGMARTGELAATLPGDQVALLVAGAERLLDRLRAVAGGAADAGCTVGVDLEHAAGA